MKKVTDKIIIFIWVVVLLFLIITFLSQCSLLYGNESLTLDDLTYEMHNVFKTCFASNYVWNNDDDSAVLDIPDRCDGYRVTALGGYIGSGGPSPFIVNLPDAIAVYSEASLPENAQITQYHLTINVGKHLRNDEFIEMDVFHKVGTNHFVQILVSVNCSPQNPCFYSEDGKLYRRLNGSLVEGFFYYSDYKND